MNKNAWLIALAESPNARFWRLDFNDLTRAEQVFRAIWELESQVNNGGLEQYFLNSSGELAWFAPTALEIIGATKMALIVQRACSLLPHEWQPGLELVGAEQLGGLAALDAEFFAYPEDLTTLLYEFVVRHRGEIAGVP